jgi:MFS transporter, YNFM family, putative membrane transport protein
VAIVAGLLLVTVGFFGAHTTASGFVGRRASLLPGGKPALASALYLLAYYAGSSIGGTLGGVAYDHAGWPGVVAFVAALLAGALGLAMLLRRVPAAPNP